MVDIVSGFEVEAGSKCALDVGLREGSNVAPGDA
jgi:hypothetical protein